MFQSYKYIKSLDYKNKNSFEYEITDSEFGVSSGITDRNSYDFSLEIWFAVIEEYNKRNLNVAANLAVAMIWWCKKYKAWSIENIIYLNNKYNPLFSQYEKDLQKYLLLL